jgi:hypothetical protein
LKVRELTRENEQISKIKQNLGPEIDRIEDSIHFCYRVSRWPGFVSVFSGISTKFGDEKKSKVDGCCARTTPCPGYCSLRAVARRQYSVLYSEGSIGGQGTRGQSQVFSIASHEYTGKDARQRFIGYTTALGVPWLTFGIA